MNRYPILPKKYHFESLPSITDYPFCKVYRKKEIIKELSTDMVSLNVLEKAVTLDVPGYSLKHDIYQNEDGSKIYLISPFLSYYQTIDLVFPLVSKVTGLKYFKQMLLSLKEVHQKKFNPYDIHPGNYMIGPNNDIVCVDYGTSFFDHKFTISIKDSFPSRCAIFFANSPFGTFNLNSYYLNLLDKLYFLSMLLYYVRYSRPYMCDIYYHSLFLEIQRILYLDIFPDSIQSYLQSITFGIAPSEDDYFIEDLIDPLISYYSKGLILEKGN